VQAFELNAKTKMDGPSSLSSRGCGLHDFQKQLKI